MASIHRIGALLIVASMLIAAPRTCMAEAGESPAAGEKFRALDANHDGFIARDEVRRYPGYGTAFEAADLNHDGKLDAGEFIKAEAVYQRGQAAQTIGDTLITAKIKAALIKEMKSNSVSVATHRGQVTLSGTVDSPVQRSQAVQVAASVDGVVKVKNGLRVK